MIKDSYLVLDDRAIWTEKQCRQYLLEEEQNDIVNNINDYLDDTLNIKNQLCYIKMAIKGKIEDVIYTLGNSWNVPILDLTKDYTYKGVKAVFKKKDDECITIDFYDIKTNKLLDADIEIYYRHIDKVHNVTKLDDFQSNLENFINENYIKKGEFYLVEKYKINIDNEDIVYGKLNNENYYMITDTSFCIYDNKYSFNLYNELFNIALGENNNYDDKWSNSNAHLIESYYLDDVRLFKNFRDNDVI